MIPGFHGLDLIVILVVALLIFGPKRLPEMGSAIGKSIKEFRKGVSELTSPKDEKEVEHQLPASNTEMSKPGANAINSEVSYKTTQSEISSPETNVE